MTTLLLRCVALAVVLVVAGTPWAEAEINRQVMEEQHDDADGEAGSSEEGVVALSEDTFREEVERGQPLLVYYYTKWCRHCVATGPMIEALPAELRDQDDLDDLDVIKVAKVDVEAEKGLAEQQGISGFPTIRLYKDGRRDEFYGERSVPSLVQWLKRKMGLGVQRLQSMSDARKMLADHPVVTVGFFKDADSDQATMFKAASAALDKTPFAVVHDEEMFSEYGVEDGTVVVFKKFDERRVDVLLAHSAASLTEVLRRAARPLVADFRREDAHEISSAAGNANRTLFVAFLSKRAGHYELLHDTLHAMALEHVNNVSLVAVNVDDDDSDPVKAAFSLANTTAMPAMRMYNFATGHRYEPRTDRMTADAVRDFVAGVQSGALKPTNAVDAPEEQVTDVQNGVKSLTTATFDREVYDGRHHALVLFYTNSCPHCNTFKPVFEEVAAAVAGEPSLTMAKIDMGKYRPKSTGVEIEGVPYVVMYPRCGKDSPLVYGGSREPAALLEFVENHSGLAVRKARSVSARGAGRGKDREEL